MKLSEMSEEQRKKYNCDAVKRSYRKHHAARLEAGRQWRIDNAVKFAAMKRAWRLANPEKVKAQKERYRKKYADKIRAKNLAYQRANPDKCRVWRKRHYAKNPEMFHNCVLKRRGVVQAQNSRLTRGLTKRLFASQGGLCARCHCDLTKSKFHRDHIIPISKGGPHCDSNIQLLCPTCNLSKGAKVV